MKEEELIKKLENAKLPDIELESHRRRLKMALLAAGYLNRQPRVTILELAKSKMRGGMDTMIRGLVSRQPVWKTAMASVLAIALIIGLTITLPGLTGQSSEALAAEIAENSPQVRAALGDGEIKVVKVIKVVDDKGTVICEGTMGRLVTAEVDLENKEVTDVKVAIEIVDMPELSEADEQAAINIAKADPKVQEILDEGASVYNVHPSCSFGMRVSPETGETEEFSEVLAVVVLASGVEEWEGGTVYNPDGEVWFVHVDLAQEKVVRIINPKDFPEAAPSGKFKIESFDVNEEGCMKLHLGKGGIERNTQ